MDDKIFIERQISFMNEIIKLHKELKDIHVSLEKLYPITVIDNGHYFIFDINKSGNNYEFKIKMENQIPISGDILAAFPISIDNNDIPSAVISNNILENQDNYIFIFHEFVHCFQMENGEFDIRKKLLVEKQEMAKNNYSWELNFPFPYNNENFINKTIELSNFFINGDFENVVNYHKNMKSNLEEKEFEYMIWQEWKEGFARFIENLIRSKLNMQLNNNLLKPPFGRVNFYEIGSKYIEMLISRNNGLKNDIIELFNVMKNITLSV